MCRFAEDMSQQTHCIGEYWRREWLLIVLGSDRKDINIINRSFLSSVTTSSAFVYFCACFFYSTRIRFIRSGFVLCDPGFQCLTSISNVFRIAWKSVDYVCICIQGDDVFGCRQGNSEGGRRLVCHFNIVASEVSGQYLGCLGPPMVFRGCEFSLCPWP